MSNLMKIRSVETELLPSDRQIDMVKVIVAFCNFAKAHKATGVKKS